MSTNRKYLFSLLSLGVFAALIVLFFALTKWFNPDEFEHIHSAWYVKSGSRPYTDFFQHHHPFLWYVLIPFLAFFGHCTRTVLAIRVFMFFLTVAISVVVYLITFRASRSREAGLFSVLAVLPTVVFVRTSVTLRPDVPMALFGLLSVYFLVRFIEKPRNKYMACCGLAAFVSFMFLQKSVFLLAAYAILFAHQLVKKKISLRSVAYFCLFFCVPLGAYLTLLAISGTIGDYFLTNWLLNASHLPAGVKFPPWGDRELLVGSYVFWGLAAFSLGYVLLVEKSRRILRVIGFLVVVLLLSLFTYKGPLLHYFFLQIGLLAVLIGPCLQVAFERLRLVELYRFVVAVVIVVNPLHHVVRMCDDAVYERLEKVDYVLLHSDEADYIYDGDNAFNLFRRDLHYFWYYFGPGRGLDAYNRLTNNKYGDYDICELIREKRPKFISDYRLDVTGSGLDELYARTKYDGLYIRKASR